MAKTYFPNCIVAIDPFHVIKHLQSDFNRLRVDLMNKCPYGSNSYYLIKKWSWLLMKDNVNLDNEKVYNSRFKMKLNRRDLRGMIFSAFPELSAAYDLKELYRRMNRDCSYDEAAALYDDVLGAFRSSGIHQYNEFMEILMNWKEEIQYQGASAISVASGKESFLLYPRMFSTLYPPAYQVTAYPGKREGRTTRSTIGPFKKHSRPMLEVL